jgi:hypothetical protein
MSILRNQLLKIFLTGSDFSCIFDKVAINRWIFGKQFMQCHKKQHRLYLGHEILDSRELLAVAPAPLRIVQNLAETVTYKTTSVGPPLKLTIIMPGSTLINPSGVPIVFGVHGGGWVKFDRNNILSDLKYLPAEGYALIAPDYTLATSRKPSWPNNLTDLQDALDWTVKNGVKYGLDTSNITLVGQSAGGHLAGMLSIRESEQRDSLNGPLIDRLIDVSGPMNLPRLIGESSFAAGRAKTMLGMSYDQNPSLWRTASPAFQLEANPNIKMPVTLIIQGTVDPVVPINQSTEFQNQLVKLSAVSRLEKIIGAGHDLLKGAIASKTRKLILDFLKNGV